MTDYPVNMDGTLSVSPLFKTDRTWSVMPEDYARACAYVIPEKVPEPDPFKILGMCRYYTARWNRFRFDSLHLARKA
jgi:hypothetical protein